MKDQPGVLLKSRAPRPPLPPDDCSGRHGDGGVRASSAAAAAASSSSSSSSWRWATWTSFSTVSSARWSSRATAWTTSCVSRRVDKAAGSCHRHHRARRFVIAGRSPTADRFLCPDEFAVPADLQFECARVFVCWCCRWVSCLCRLSLPLLVVPLPCVAVSFFPVLVFHQTTAARAT